MQKRVLYLCSGIILMLFSGIIYSWAVFEQGILGEYPEWANQLSLTFTFTMNFFVLGGIVGGLLRKRLAGRWIARIGSVLALIGFLITSRAESIITLYLCYGVLCGFGIGLAYNATINTITLWFPEKPGIASGCLLTGFGIGSMIINQIGASMIIAMGWRNMILILGIVIACVSLICSLALVPVSADMQLPYQEMRATNVTFTTKETLKKRTYWFQFMAAVLFGIGGITVISYAIRIVGDVTGLVGDELLLLGATFSGIVSVCNGLSRILLGVVFDKLGQKAAILVGGLSGFLGVVFALFALLTNSLVFLGIGFFCTGIAYGGMGTVYTSILKNMYGNESYAMNIGIFNIHLLIASIFGPIIANAIYDATQSYTMLFVVLVAAGAVGLFFLSRVRFSKKELQQMQQSLEQ